MSFKGISPETWDEIRTWPLTTFVVRDFSLRLLDFVERKSPNELPYSERDGLAVKIVVPDYEQLGSYDSFEVRFVRNDLDFWVSQVACVGVRQDGIFWSSKD